MRFRAFAVLGVVALLAGCTFHNRYERQAQSITDAIIANDIRPIQSQISPGIPLTRVKIAELSDELADQGKLRSLKETTVDCPPAVHCFTLKFERSTYEEKMKLDENGKVSAFDLHDVPATAGTGQ